MFGHLPNPGKNWRLHEQGTNATPSLKFRSSWVVLTNSVNGDVLSFYADEFSGITPSTPTNQGPWAEMPITHFPGGYPAWSKPVGLRIKSSEWSRTGVVGLAKGQVAVDSSTIWEDESGAKRLAHGYGLALGELRLYVQHTSATIITPELAQDMAHGLINIYSKRKTDPNTGRSVQPQKTDGQD